MKKFRYGVLLLMLGLLSACGNSKGNESGVTGEAIETSTEAKESKREERKELPEETEETSDQEEKRYKEEYNVLLPMLYAWMEYPKALSFSECQLHEFCFADVNHDGKDELLVKCTNRTWDGIKEGSYDSIHCFSETEGGSWEYGSYSEFYGNGLILNRYEDTDAGMEIAKDGEYLACIGVENEQYNWYYAPDESDEKEVLSKEAFQRKLEELAKGSSKLKLDWIEVSKENVDKLLPIEDVDGIRSQLEADENLLSRVVECYSCNKLSYLLGNTLLFVGGDEALDRAVKSLFPNGRMAGLEERNFGDWEIIAPKSEVWNFINNTLGGKFTEQDLETDEDLRESPVDSSNYEISIDLLLGDFLKWENHVLSMKKLSDREYAVRGAVVNYSGDIMISPYDMILEKNEKSTLNGWCIKSLAALQGFRIEPMDSSYYILNEEQDIVAAGETTASEQAEATQMEVAESVQTSAVTEAGKYQNVQIVYKGEHPFVNDEIVYKMLEELGVPMDCSGTAEIGTPFYRESFGMYECYLDFIGENGGVASCEIEEGGDMGGGILGYAIP